MRPTRTGHSWIESPARRAPSEYRLERHAHRATHGNACRGGYACPSHAYDVLGRHNGPDNVSEVLVVILFTVSRVECCSEVDCAHAVTRSWQCRCVNAMLVLVYLLISRCQDVSKFEQPKRSALTALYASVNKAECQCATDIRSLTKLGKTRIEYLDGRRLALLDWNDSYSNVRVCIQPRAFELLAPVIYRCDGRSQGMPRNATPCPVGWVPGQQKVNKARVKCMAAA